MAVCVNHTAEVVMLWVGLRGSRKQPPTVQ